MPQTKFTKNGKLYIPTEDDTTLKLGECACCGSNCTFWADAFITDTITEYEQVTGVWSVDTVAQVLNVDPSSGELKLLRNSPLLDDGFKYSVTLHQDTLENWTFSLKWDTWEFKLTGTTEQPSPPFPYYRLLWEVIENDGTVDSGESTWEVGEPIHRLAVCYTIDNSFELQPVITCTHNSFTRSVLWRAMTAGTDFSITYSNEVGTTHYFDDWSIEFSGTAIAGCGVCSVPLLCGVGVCDDFAPPNNEYLLDVAGFSGTDGFGFPCADFNGTYRLTSNLEPSQLPPAGACIYDGPLEPQIPGSRARFADLNLYEGGNNVFYEAGIRRSVNLDPYYTALSSEPARIDCTALDHSFVWDEPALPTGCTYDGTPARFYFDPAPAFASVGAMRGVFPRSSKKG